MTMIYLSEEVAEELDRQVDTHNKTNPPTDRSGYVGYLLQQKR